MKYYIKKFVSWFLSITTGILIMTTITIVGEGFDEIPTSILWRILISGAITSFITTIFYAKRVPDNRVLIHMILHYLSMCIAMVLMGSWFGWMEVTVLGVIIMCASVALVYVFVYATNYFINLRDTNEINKKLKEKYGE